MAKRKSASKKPSPSSSASASASKRSKKSKLAVESEEVKIDENVVSEAQEVCVNGDHQVEVEGDEEVSESPQNSEKKNSRKLVKRDEFDCRFLGDPVPADEAKLRWPLRYPDKVFAFHFHSLEFFLIFSVFFGENFGL